MSDIPDGLKHRPVLYQEIIHGISPVRGGFYVDCTVGAGGHAWGILEASAPDGLLLGLDVDPLALSLARERLVEFGSRAILVQASYTTLAEQLRDLHWPPVDGIVLDLGVSSMQLDQRQRGFSFLAEAPLDMRFDPANPLRAADLVNHLPESDLADLLFRYGEETQARKIARAIVAARPLNTTTELANVVEQALRRQAGSVRRKGHRTSKRGKEDRSAPRIHPATLTFQALRIAVNHELEAVETVLSVAVGALAPGGRLAIISFHSLEDRLVKQFFRRESQDCLCPPRQPICTCGHKASLHVLTPHPLRPQDAEVVQNPRSRSARLRVAERVHLSS